jgi:calcium channel MID1
MNSTFPNGTSLEKAAVDAASASSFLVSSRNPRIDDIIQPGPYKELLPCDDLCYNIVRSCPAAMGFACPRPGHIAFNYSYGLMPDNTANQQGQITCNYPGVDIRLIAGGRKVSQPHKLILLALVVVILMFT